MAETAKRDHKDRLFKDIFSDRKRLLSLYNAVNYFSRLYEKILTQRKSNIYSPVLVKIPKPKFIVFYNGLRNAPDKSELRLSDAFEVADKSGRFEWTCDMLNINEGHNTEIMKNCEELDAYAVFVARVRSNMKNGMSTDEAVEEAL